MVEQTCQQEIKQHFACDDVQRIPVTTGVDVHIGRGIHLADELPAEGRVRFIHYGSRYFTYRILEWYDAVRLEWVSIANWWNFFYGITS